MTSLQSFRIILTLAALLCLTFMLGRCTCGELTGSQAACAKSSNTAKACSACCKSAAAAGWMYSSDSCTCIQK